MPFPTIEQLREIEKWAQDLKEPFSMFNYCICTCGAKKYVFELLDPAGLIIRKLGLWFTYHNEKGQYFQYPVGVWEIINSVKIPDWLDAHLDRFKLMIRDNKAPTLNREGGALIRPDSNWDPYRK